MFGNYANLDPNQSYDSFTQIKKALGSAGEDAHWHHIVEQCQQGKSGFTVQQINTVRNMYPIDKVTHAQITGYYNTTTFDFTDGLKVRDWLGGQSFEFQYNFGIDVLRKYGVIE